MISKYHFIKKNLTNPPGPRTPTVINSAVYPKPNKPPVGEKTAAAQQRKRKQESGDPAEGIPAKSKHMSKF